MQDPKNPNRAMLSQKIIEQKDHLATAKVYKSLKMLCVLNYAFDF